MAYKPQAHNAVSPYLLVQSVAQMLDFLSKTFSAEILYRLDGPNGRIRHAEVRIDDSVIMMGERPQADAPFACSTHVYVPDVDACYARALAAGASSLSPPTDQDYGDRSSGVTDPQGNIWWIGTHLKNQ